jgi:large subunit ribosomal protein L15
MPLYRRLPKRGFKNRFRVEYEILNVQNLSGFEAGATVGPEELVAAGLVRKGRLVKLLGEGTVETKLTIRVHRASKSAFSKIEAAGGTLEVIGG